MTADSVLILIYFILSLFVDRNDLIKISKLIISWNSLRVVKRAFQSCYPIIYYQAVIILFSRIYDDSSMYYKISIIWSNFSDIERSLSGSRIWSILNLWNEVRNWVIDIESIDEICLYSKNLCIIHRIIRSWVGGWLINLVVEGMVEIQIDMTPGYKYDRIT